METQTYLLFRLNDLPYGIQTTYVREIFQLPELTPIADAPSDIIGILNFRGTLLPVMHLAKRLGQTMPPCHLQDRAINEVYANSQQIAQSTKQQAVGVQQVVSAMNAINLGAKETVTAVGQVQSSTEELKNVAQKLQVAV